MKQSSLVRWVDALGYDPKAIKAMIVKPDEIEIREVGNQVSWFLNNRDVPGLEKQFDDLVLHLDEKAPVPLGEVTSVRLDFRGVSVQVSNGLLWQIPWEDE
jgi:hypothetical protein